MAGVGSGGSERSRPVDSVVEDVAEVRTLAVWHRTMALARRVHEATEGFPLRERFVLGAQLRRSAVSVPSNLAEGCGRHSAAEFRRFLRIAYGSLMELETQLELAQSVGLLEGQTARCLLEEASQIGRMIHALLSRLEEKLGL